ncbi:ECF-type sigma factor [Verrucomicrobiales bacterium]|jgi:RNA polymerase sigma factor (TIGR02999 family)|nr:ECF-type sigma factor [bacterium]MDB2347732.1 ECF-type sigma factor [Verrucomicrobiales bacterium]NCF87848.1 sigma-70 family RNA polymerase sigma factor [Verrucomicrobiaceae bacterium]MDB4808760.1 ECF-type sigma factor [Verrucomicrobiales bacterium]MDF1789642.1 ECF-type sigma factor [Verrucomicrobiales bacterium]
MSEITAALQSRVENGASDEQLMAAVYEELRAMAKKRMANEPEGHTLQATALVHEVWMRISDQQFENRRHFFFAASEAMRRILVDCARRKKAACRGGGLQRIDVNEIDALEWEQDDDEVLAIHDVLERLEEREPRKAELVKLRYFVGMTGEEVAAALDISLATVNRDWAFARAWLFREISLG